MAFRTAFLAVLYYAATIVLAVAAVSPADGPVAPLQPSDAAIRRNAFSIFNAVHSAMRQWGSSLNHNGMSLFLATVPAGQLLYHGGAQADRPPGLNGTGCEWLAFELEHAQNFARSGDGGRRGPPGVGRPGEDPPKDPPGEEAAEAAWDMWDMWDAFHGARVHAAQAFHDDGAATGQKPLAGNDNGDGNDPPRRPMRPFPSWRGYFHTYRAARPLNLLYIDGMGAGKTDFGCLDTQDHLLLDWPTEGEGGDGGRRRSFGGELARAMGLCDLAKEWAWDGGRIDGFIRTEAGFEIIYCDFGEGAGLDVVSIQPSPFTNETGGLPTIVDTEFLRGVSYRYHGQPAGRIHIDWSSMVSAFFYDVNLTNPDANRPELPRLISAARDERRGIRARLQEVVAARHPLENGAPPVDLVDWQGIVDLVVTRYSARLRQLAAAETTAALLAAARIFAGTMLHPYINYQDRAEKGAVRIARCAAHYLSAAREREAAWTPEDRSLHLAVETVTHAICTSLFDIRNILFDEADNAHVGKGEEEDDDDEQKAAAVRKVVSDLMAQLEWTTWKECDPCPHPDELCLVAMFPWGNEEDHFNPRCQKTTDKLRTRTGYWWKGFFRT